MPTLNTNIDEDEAGDVSGFEKLTVPEEIVNTLAGVDYQYR
jgi:hypothetical protein